MSQPQNLNLYDQSQTMFYTEGETNAVLVTRKGEHFEQSKPPVATALRAFAWCRKHRAGFVYMPAIPNN